MEDEEKNKRIMSRNLQYYLNKNNLTRYEFLEEINKFSPNKKFVYSTVSGWIQADTYPRIDYIQIMADFFKINKSDLIEDKFNVEPIYFNREKLIKMPVLGSIPAGTAIEAIEDIEDFLMISKDRLKDGVENYFLLKIKGNSMYPKYLDGDVILFRINPSPDNGKDCAVMVNGDDATFKQFFKYENRIELRPYNRDYEIQVFTPKEVINLPIRVIGEAESLEYRNLN